MKDSAAAMGPGPAKKPRIETLPAVFGMLQIRLGTPKGMVREQLSVVRQLVQNVKDYGGRFLHAG
jgi:hypothetical protein